MEGFELERMTFDAQWDLAGYAGFSPHLDAMVVAFRGTDSHSYSNWAENMRYWRTDLHLPYPGAEGALVHTGKVINTQFSPHMRTGSICKLACTFCDKRLVAYIFVDSFKLIKLLSPSKAAKATRLSRQSLKRNACVKTSTSLAFALQGIPPAD